MHIPSIDLLTTYQCMYNAQEKHTKDTLQGYVFLMIASRYVL